jgi:hypothetical protein
MEDESGQRMHFLIQGNAEVLLNAYDDEDAYDEDAELGNFKNDAETGPESLTGVENPRGHPRKAGGGLKKVERPAEQLLRVLDVGDYFGEIAMILGIKRTASVRARNVCQTFFLSKQDLTFFNSYYPEIAVGVGTFVEYTTQQFENYTFKAKPEMEAPIDQFSGDRQKTPPVLKWGVSSTQESPALGFLAKMKHLGRHRAREEESVSTLEQDRLSSSLKPVQVFDAAAGAHQRCEAAFGEMDPAEQEKVLKQLAASHPGLLSKLAALGK